MKLFNAEKNKLMENCNDFDFSQSTFFSIFCNTFVQFYLYFSVLRKYEKKTKKNLKSFVKVEIVLVLKFIL